MSWASRTGVLQIQVQLRQKVFVQPFCCCAQSSGAPREACRRTHARRRWPRRHLSHIPSKSARLVRTFCLQSSSLTLRFSGVSIPKKDDGRPWTSRCLFTKAEKEETQFPMKWSALPKTYRSIWANSGWRLTTFTWNQRQTCQCPGDGSNRWQRVHR